MLTDDERAEVVQLAADLRYITITNVAGYPFPTRITSGGRAFVDEWS